MWGAGLFVVDPASGRSRALPLDPHDPRALPDDSVYTITEDRDGVIWAGTRRGLTRVQPDTLEMKTFTHDPQDRGSLSHDRVSAIFEDSRGDLWVGTWGGYLNLWAAADRRAGRPRFTRMDDRVGLFANTIAGVLEDAAGQIWVSTTEGLFEYDAATGRFRSFGLADGLLNHRFNPRALCRRSNGELLFGGFYGIVLYQPETLPKSRHAPPVLISGIKRFGEPLATQREPFDLPELVLTHRDATVTFEFAALDFVAPERNRFAHTLSGFDSGWIQLGHRGEATYTALPPGRYVLRVKASNSDGVWNEDGASLPITVLPPPWRTWWAWVLYVTIVAGTGTVAYRLRIRQMLRRARQLEAQVEERTADLSRAIAELRRVNELRGKLLGMAAHDLRSPLQSISVNSELLNRRLGAAAAGRPEVERITGAVRRMKETIDQVLEGAAIEAGELVLHRSDLNFGELVEAAVEGLRPLAERKQQRIEVRADSPSTVHGDRLFLIQVVENLLSNAIKFSPLGGTIWVSVDCRNGHVVLALRDEGPGITPEDREKLFGRFQRLSARPTGGESSTGLGLSICRDLVSLHSGQIHVESSPGAGSTFSVLLPART